MTDQVIDVKELRVQFDTDDGVVHAVRDVSFSVARGETLGIVGESGSGKTVTNLAILGLIPQPPGRITGGSAWYGGKNLTDLTTAELARIRGNRVAMIFQDPMTALNPFLTIQEQMTEVTRLHLKHSKAKALSHAIEMLERVGISSASRRIRDFPHQFSGGMRQRVMIAMALSCRPDVLIADEPTTALDVTIQAQILDLMEQLQREEGTAIIIITHDLGVIAKLCHRVAVMYAGRIVEEADTQTLFARPKHPYTLGLLRSVPRIDDEISTELCTIEGQPPDLTNLPSGCSFHPRCEWCVEACRRDEPPLVRNNDGGRHACFVQLQEDVRRTST